MHLRVTHAARSLFLLDRSFTSLQPPQSLLSRSFFLDFFFFKHMPQPALFAPMQPPWSLLAVSLQHPCSFLGNFCSEKSVLKSCSQPPCNFFRIFASKNYSIFEVDALRARQPALFAPMQPPYSLLAASVQLFGQFLLQTICLEAAPVPLFSKFCSPRILQPCCYSHICLMDC